MSYNFPKTYNLLSTQTASNSASISFTSFVSSSYSEYFVFINNYVPVNNGNNIHLTFSTDNGATYLNTNYKWANYYNYTGGNGVNNNNSDSIIRLQDTVSNVTSNSWNTNISLFDLNSNTYSPKIYSYSCLIANGGVFSTINAIGLNTTTTAVNAIKFAASSGNISTGTFYLYGRNNI